MIAVVLVFALVGALVLGALVGLLYRGWLFIGDRRQLEIFADQLRAEQRISAVTLHTMAAMRAAARQTGG